MIRMCAWCGIALGMIAEEAPPTGDRVSHGICTDCRVEVLEGAPRGEDDLYASSSTPSFLVSGGMEILEANAATATLLKRDRETIVGEPGGGALGCVHAGPRGECGQSQGCSGCAVLESVSVTHACNVSCSRVPVLLTMDRGAGPEEVHMLVSTSKVGDHVLVVLDRNTGL